MRAPDVGGEALEEDEAFAVEKVVAEGGEDFAEFGEGKVVLELETCISLIVWQAL